MFAKLEFQQNTTANNLLADIVAVITGETDPNNLSADVVVANSFVLTDYATSPWELWDDVAGDKKIVRTQQADSGDYKYVGFHHNSGPLTGVQYSISAASDWDKILHTGTDVTGPDYSYNNLGSRQQIAAFQWYIFADEFQIYLILHTDYNLLGNAIGSNIKYGGIGTWECDRGNPSLDIGDMPNWFIGSGPALVGGDANTRTRNLTFVKGRDYTGSVVTPFKSYGGVAVRGTYNFSTIEYNIVESVCPATLSGTDKFPIEHISIMGSGYDIPTNCQGSTFLGSVSSRCNIWFTGEGIGDCFDFVLFNGQKYIIMKGGHDTSTSGFAAGAKFLMPYG